ncbi:MAG: hypothetical protein EBX41_00840 [Chitinophagia bacterium]|nr:hypothetical protein [Chitinophagia bacterium]
MTAVTIRYKGDKIPFKDLFYQYCKVKEGYRNSVYKDHKGFDTIGVGHLITGKEPFQIFAGKTYDDSQIKQLFDLDYERLSIDTYVSELQNEYFGYNMMLAVGHFIWAHGSGQYHTSNLRAGIINATFTLDTVIEYLDANWDLKSKPNQRVNREDFKVGFAATPWEPGFILPSPSN